VEPLEDRLTPSFTDLGTLGGIYSEALGMNDVGQVVGVSATTHGTVDPFLWEDGAMTDLPTFGGPVSLAYGVNDTDQIVGGSDVDDVEHSHHAFLWHDGAMTDLGTLGGTYSDAKGINDEVAGCHPLQIVGSASTNSGAILAFLWQHGAMASLGTLGGPTTGAAAINDGDADPTICKPVQIVGSADTVSAGRHALLWQDGVMTDLGTLGNPNFSNSDALALNDYGQVVGVTDTLSGDRHAFLWQDGVMTDLGTLPQFPQFPDSVADGINDAGQIVGSVYRPNGGGRAFLWQDGVMTDLGTLANANSTAHAINTAGQIVGGLDTVASFAHAYLYNPDGSPASLRRTHASSQAADPHVRSVATLLTGLVSLSGDRGESGGAASSTQATSSRVSDAARQPSSARAALTPVEAVPPHAIPLGHGSQAQRLDLNLDFADALGLATARADDGDVSAAPFGRDFV
jgi:probable HAF family extracellular repeat protein